MDDPELTISGWLNIVECLLKFSGFLGNLVDCLPPLWCAEVGHNRQGSFGTPGLPVRTMCQPREMKK